MALLPKTRQYIHETQPPTILYKIFVDMTAKLERRQRENRIVSKTTFTHCNVSYRKFYGFFKPDFDIETKFNPGAFYGRHIN